MHGGKEEEAQKTEVSCFAESLNQKSGKSHENLKNKNKNELLH
jgi:hypothetical protein